MQQLKIFKLSRPFLPARMNPRIRPRTDSSRSHAWSSGREICALPFRSPWWSTWVQISDHSPNLYACSATGVKKITDHILDKRSKQRRDDPGTI